MTCAHEWRPAVAPEYECARCGARAERLLSGKQAGMLRIYNRRPRRAPPPLRALGPPPSERTPDVYAVLTGSRRP